MSPKQELELHEDDIILLETLIQSPVFSALKRLLDQYRKQCYSTLLHATELHHIHQIQGRIIGMNVIENLPGQVILEQKKNAKKREKPAPFVKNNSQS